MELSSKQQGGDGSGIPLIRRQNRSVQVDLRSEEAVSAVTAVDMEENDVKSEKKMSCGSSSTAMSNGDRRRDFRLDVLVAIFGMSSWISVNGLWVQLPLIVNDLPEYYDIASYLSILTQMANVGPLLYGLARFYYAKRHRGRQLNPAWVIYPLLAVGCAASLLLVFFWDETAVVGGEEHSVALFALVFFLSLVDCTSSVLFMPYMAAFRQTYFNSYLVGEGLSGFVPAIFALIQGVGGNPECQTVTKYNETTGAYYTVEEPVTDEPRFSVEVFFGLLLLMMLLSSAAFAAIDNLKTFDSERVINVTVIKTDEDQDDKLKDLSGSRDKFALFLAVITYICFVSNGALPSIQTYSLAPYGNVVYHLAATINSMSNPCAALTAHFLPTRKTLWVLLLSVAGSVFAGYILATALTSPELLAGQDAGGALAVIAWVCYGGLFSYVKVSVAGWCLDRSERSLFWCGAFTQLGSALGSLLMFFLVNDTDIFQAYYVTC